MKRKRVIRILAAAFFVLLLALTFFSKTLMNRSLPVVNAQRVRSGEVTPYVSGSGIVESAGSIAVAQELPVTVEEILVAAGDSVTRGQPLLRVTVSDDGSVEKLREETAEAQYQYDYALAAAGSWIDSLTKMSLDHQREGLEKKQAELAEAEARLGAKTLAASCDGVVTELPVAEGGFYAAQAPLCILQALAQSYLVRYHVPREAAQTLSIGDTAQYIGNDGLLHEATLLQLLPVSSDLDDGLSAVFTVTDVLPGQILTLTVVQETTHYDCTVPSAAVRYDADGNAFVYALTEKDTPLGIRYYVNQTAVTVLSADDNRAALAPELPDGAYVVTFAEELPANGEQVRIHRS